MKKIAIIGAGLAGLTVANKLKEHAQITIFEKSRGVGGRVATRRAPPFAFDHGAQFFKADTEQFKNFIKPMLAKGIIQRWDAKFVEFDHDKLINERKWSESHPHYVGAPGMNAIGKYLTKDLNVQLNKKITSIEKNDTWTLTDQQGNKFSKFDWLITTAPAAQTTDLLPKEFKYYQDIKSTKMIACFSLMLGFSQALNLNFDAALIRNADISWISVNSSKPKRDTNYCLLVHSSNQWAEQKLTADPRKILKHLCEQTSKIINQDVNLAQHKALHLWRFANISKQAKNKVLIDPQQQLAACGDWCIQGRVEAAFLSGFKLANAIKKIIE